MSENIYFLEILGGLSLILYGIHLSGVNLQKILGSYLEELLKKAKGSPLKGILVGTAATGLIHSSGTTSVMLISLITGSIMGIGETVPIMLGANIGSTIATQLASLQIGGYVFLILAAGVLVHMASEKKFGKQIGEALIGFGLLLLGSQFLFLGIGSISDNDIFTQTLRFLTISPLSAIIFSALATVVLRSASFMSILTVALGAVSAINLPTSLFLILGINLGSSFKFVYLSIRGKNFSGRLAFIHLMSNLFGLFVFILFFGYFQELVQATSIHPARQIANANTIYNLVSALLFIPFIPAAIRLSQQISPDSRRFKKNELCFLDRKLICTPSVSLSEVNRGAVEMAQIASEMLESSRLIFFEDRTDLLEKIKQQESKIDDMTEKISEYTMQVSQQSLSRRDKLKLYSLMHIVADIEHLCDRILAVSEIFVKIKNNGAATFSDKAQSELTAVYGKLKIIQNLVVKALKEDNTKLASEISEHENKVDEIIKKISHNSDNRLKKGKCDTVAAKYFSDILYNLERIGDHYDNIAFAIMDREKSEERK